VDTPAANVLQVRSGANVCSLDTNTLSSGAITARVTNPGNEKSSFVIIRVDSDAEIVTIRDVAAGSTKEVTLALAAGRYLGRCEPGTSEIPFTVG
jgi:iron uptake system component EfeO